MAGSGASGHSSGRCKMSQSGRIRKSTPTHSNVSYPTSLVVSRLSGPSAIVDIRNDNIGAFRRHPRHVPGLRVGSYRLATVSTRVMRPLKSRKFGILNAYIPKIQRSLASPTLQQQRRFLRRRRLPGTARRSMPAGLPYPCQVDCRDRASAPKRRWR